ncbi:MAG: 2-oxoacid:acceptor oxidoreductase family protein [Firmicutes bacterium]|nr:2-oxoacid:acceptor oxidoreductase family protein [Bacillota bacterium]
MARLVKIAIAGEGGQGVQAIGDVLAEAGNAEGKEALYIPNFGVEQRGGVSVAFVQISDEQIGSPKFQSGDIVIALSERAVARTKQYVTKDTLFVYDSSLISVPEVADEAVGMQVYDTVAPEAMAVATSEQVQSSAVQLPTVAKQIIGIPATEIAQRELTPRVFNMIVLGATIRAAGIINMETIRKALEHKLGPKFEADPKLRELNYRALERGVELVEEALQKEGK